MQHRFTLELAFSNMDGLTLTSLDGADTIGGSKLLLEYDGHGALLDFGMNFARTNRYYEEYIKPRSTTGLLDHVTMGTMPDVRGIYRRDLMHPNLVLTGKDVVRVDAVLLSHGHIDHSGDIGFLKRDIPVATTAMTAAIVKASEDCTRNEPGREPIYFVERDLREKRGAKLLCRSRGGILWRKYHLLDTAPTESLNEFWAFIPSHALKRRLDPAETVPAGLSHGLEGIDCEMMPVDHSIKGACAFLLDTSKGRIVYTGDLRMHGLEQEMTREFVSKARASKPYVMVIEGTRAPGDREDDSSTSSSTTEGEVRETADLILSAVGGDLAIADFGPRNVERLEIFLDASRRSRRRLVVTAKDAYLLHAMHIVDPSVPIPGGDMLVYDSPKGSTDKYEEWVVEHGYTDSLVRPTEVGRSPGDYLLSMSFYDMKHLIDIKPDRGHYIFSSSEAHNEEQIIDFIRLGRWLTRFGIRAHGFRIDEEEKPVFESEDGALHASGHASAKDLTKMVREIDPEILIPVHTENPKWFERTFSGERKVILPKRYETVVL
ncbi:MAG: MBL fold metallo-hydrolase [Methanobacteriota archaeon]|nr:MAG: MBL fold metallo-hydrolase [Euryarchaeota archaeon]